MRSNCILYAVGKFIREGGYLKLRRTRLNRFRWLVFWHVLHETDDGKVTSFVPFAPVVRTLPPLFYLGYIKEGDE